MEILNELFDSSSSSSSSSDLDVTYSTFLSSSSDDDDIEILKFLHSGKQVTQRIKRPRFENFEEDCITEEPKLKIHRSENFIEVIDKYSDSEFRERFRLSRETANHIIEMYRKSQYFRKATQGKQEISAKTQIYVFLWYAGSQSTLREVSTTFQVTISAAFRHLNLILDFMFEISTSYLKFPRTDVEKIEASEKFEKIAGLKNVIGCIAECYIYFNRKPPHEERLKYINGDDKLSLILQGICDADEKFLDIYIGSPSKSHNARVFPLSCIADELPSICGERFHLLGDSAYSTKEFLITPYKNFENLTKARIKYNEKHTKTLGKIHNAFDIVKQRFRLLQRLDFSNMDRISAFVLACCVLHNICIDRGDHFENNLMVDTKSSIRYLSNTQEDQIVIHETLAEAEIRAKGENKRQFVVDSLSF